MPIQFREEDDAPAATLTPGVHACTIRSVESHTSKAGNLSIKVWAKVDDGESLYEYLPPTRKSVAQLCGACGVPVPAGQELDEESLKGRTFRARLKVELGKDGYADKYRVEQWLKPQAASTPVAGAPATKAVNQQRVAAAIAGKASRQAPAAPALADDDGIPF